MDSNLCEAIERVLAAGQFQRSRSGRAMRSFVHRPLSAVGLTSSRLRKIDRALLQGRGVSTFRYLRGRLRS